MSEAQEGSKTAILTLLLPGAVAEQRAFELSDIEILKGIESALVSDTVCIQFCAL